MRPAASYPHFTYRRRRRSALELVGVVLCAAYELFLIVVATLGCDAALHFFLEWWCS